MAEPKDMVVPLIKEMRAEMNIRFDGVDKRLDKLEAGQKSFRQALTADTMMSKFITGDFEERIQALEKQVNALAKAR